MLNTKQIVADAVAAGATKIENVGIESVSFAKSDDVKYDNVDFWASFRINQAVPRMQEVNGNWVEQNSIVVQVSNIGFKAMLREAFFKDPQLVPLVTYLDAIEEDAKEIALARKAGDKSATSPIMDLLAMAKFNLVSRKVEKDTKVKALFSLNEKMSDCKRDSIWYDPYDLVITRTNDVAYDVITDKDGIPQLVTETVITKVMKHYILRANKATARREAAKANGGFASNLAARAAAAASAAANLPEE